MLFLPTVSLFMLVASIVSAVATNPTESRHDSRAVQNRQLTRAQLEQRLAIKETLRLVTKSGTRLRARASANAYPPCGASLGLVPGFAHYVGWDIPNGGKFDIKAYAPASESACETDCKQGTYGSCAGLFWSPNYQNAKFCSLKTTVYAYTSGDFSSNTGGTQSSALAATDMVGSCTYWSSVVPGAMDAVCCNT